MAAVRRRGDGAAGNGSLGAILYVDRTGTPWRCFPPRLRPVGSRCTVYEYFAAWQKDGAFVQLNGLLRRLVRETEGRAPSRAHAGWTPRAPKASADVPTAGQGIHAGKQIAAPYGPVGLCRWCGRHEAGGQARGRPDQESGAAAPAVEPRMTAADRREKPGAIVVGVDGSDSSKQPFAGPCEGRSASMVWRKR
ncbi:transposase [Streptomyces sp. BE133]|uniref:transposase n=1 Tax=Streptomyces sp. BE133 TaxID=3002523 RepID=UPI002E77749C|nr:transposase [Streptomyces sp. BE133]MEE1810381.1 transposase [Streptomyces sp. BE133]